MTYSHTAHYHYLASALNESVAAFVELEREMQAFSPRPASDFQARAATLRTTYKTHNPTMSDASLDQWVQREIEMAADERLQFVDAFNSRFMSRSVTITLLSHGLCEAVINTIVAIGLASTGNESAFAPFEGTEMKEKWVTGPQLFSPGYNFPKGGRLYETLTILSRRRNNLVHYKITLESEGTPLIAGTRIERTTFAKEADWLKRFADLPYDLHRHAISQVSNPPLHGVLSETSTRTRLSPV